MEATQSNWNTSWENARCRTMFIPKKIIKYQMQSKMQTLVVPDVILLIKFPTTGIDW